MKIKCPNCGSVNTEEQIDHWPCTNEEGEEYYEFDYYCSSCNTCLYEGSDWGEYDYEEVSEKIIDRFKTR